MKYILGGLDLVILCAALGYWIAGKNTGKDKLKKTSHILFGVWVVIDIVLIILAFSLGWFPK